MPLLLSVIQVTRLASIVLIHAVAGREREMILPSTAAAAETSFPTGETSAQYSSQEQYNCTGKI